MKKALIFSGGDFYKDLPKEEYELTIACDRGVSYAAKLNVTPDILIGDYDSLSGKPTDYFPESEILTFPVMKDDTDTMLAVKEALSRGCADITITCAYGGRMDHFISNIQTLHYIAAKGGRGTIIGEGEYMFTLSSREKQCVVSKREGYSLSLFALTDEVSGLSIKGAKYEADNITLTNSFPLGQSNGFCEDEVIITIENGVLLIVESRLE